MKISFSKAINKASESAQNIATAKICLPVMPCLRTNEFCAPIASISDSERKNPVMNAYDIASV